MASNDKLPIWKTLVSWTYPVVTLAVILLIWHYGIQWSQLPKFIIPGPWDVAVSLQEHAPRLQKAAVRTTSEAAAGLLLSVIAGFLIASLLSQARWIRQSLLPYVLIFQTVPIIGVAPLIITWFGNTFFSVVLIASFISVFPIISNTTNGMISTQESWDELFRLNRATRWQRFRLLQIPAALPLFSAGLQIAAAASVLGACVGDFFAGSGQQEGLGFLIFQAKDRDASLMFATLAVLTAIGVLFYFLATVLSRNLLLRWQERATAN